MTARGKNQQAERAQAENELKNRRERINARRIARLVDRRRCPQKDRCNVCADTWDFTSQTARNALESRDFESSTGASWDRPTVVEENALLQDTRLGGGDPNRHAPVPEAKAKKLLSPVTHLKEKNIYPTSAGPSSGCEAHLRIACISGHHIQPSRVT